MKSSNRLLQNHIATTVQRIQPRPKSPRPAGFVLILLPSPAQASGGFDFYRFLYDRTVAQVEAARRRRWEIRAARLISLN